MPKIYDVEDKARVRVLLQVNEGNVYRTAKDTGIPRETIKSWKVRWDKEGVPEEVEVRVPLITLDYVENAERVRNLALKELEKRVKGGDVQTKDLYIMFGILEDKITRAKGMATKRVETVVEMPDLRMLGEQLGSYMQNAIAAAQTRKKEIIQADGKQAIQLALSPAVIEKE